MMELRINGAYELKKSLFEIELSALFKNEKDLSCNSGVFIIAYRTKNDIKPACVGKSLKNLEEDIKTAFKSDEAKKAFPRIESVTLFCIMVKKANMRSLSEAEFFIVNYAKVKNKKLIAENLYEDKPYSPPIGSVPRRKKNDFMICLGI